MTEHLALRPHQVVREDTEDGAILLRAAQDLPEPALSVGVWLDQSADKAPERIFLAERDGEGWHELSYADVRHEVLRIAGGLLSRGLNAQTPIMILSGNSVAHALLALAAQYVGIPYAPVPEQFSLIPGARSRLEYAVRLIDPTMIFAEDGAAFEQALTSSIMQGRQVLCAKSQPPGALSLDELVGTANVDAAHASVGPHTVAKYLLTSGSTSDPKAVVTTHGMLTANQAMIVQALPFLQNTPPVLVDWLPWNHTFGGSHNFNLVLSQAGSLYIDDGKPLPAMFPRTLENLRSQAATLSFNVPVGFAQLVDALRADKALAETYFSNLDMIFYAGASLPQDIWAALEELALETTGRLPLITSSWGLTETAPGVLLQHEPGKGAGIVGVPLAGVTVKLVPMEEHRMEVRVKGPNIFQDYLRNPDKTAAAFDPEGYFLTGDAMSFVDPQDMSKGLRFAGRLSEDFKLQTGTWVRTAELRMALLQDLAPFAQDVVITGEGRHEVGMLILPNRSALDSVGYKLQPDDGFERCSALQEVLAARLRRAAQGQTGSAGRVMRAAILSDPASIGDGEITAKGNLNFAKILNRRADLVARLYDNNEKAVILV